MKKILKTRSLTRSPSLPGMSSRAEKPRVFRKISHSNSKGVRTSDVWGALRFTLCCLGHALFTLWRLNPVSLFIRRWRQLHYLNTRMALSIRPRLVDLITDFFLSGERRKRNLLSWVKSILPWVGQDILDFTACWQDGIVLCALMETISPGACPGFNLLKPHHRVNNCRLGLQLAMRYLHLTQLPLSPEEMAIADEHSEVKICQLVQMLQWKYLKQGGRPREFTNVRTEETFQYKCQARGTGIRAGIVGRRTKFNVLTDTVTRLDILIEIRGPNNEYNKEKIVSMDNGRYKERNSLPSLPINEDDSKTKIIEDGAGHSFLRQRSLDEDLGHLIIPFDYQCVGEGRFLVTYIPRSAGLHYITILSQGAHIQGSPFEVKVSDWVSSWNLVPKARVVPFDMLQTIEERPKDNLRPAAPTDKLKRQMTHVAHVSKHLTMMKRRILRKVITHNGEEIICDVTPSPTLSRQSSADCSDLSEDDILKSKHGQYRDNGVKGTSRSRGKRKMLGDIDAVEEAPELSDSMTTSVNSSASNSIDNSLHQSMTGQSKRHLLGTIRMPKSQHGDMPTPEVVITPEDDDSNGPFRLMFDSDDDSIFTEPNSPDNLGADRKDGTHSLVHYSSYSVGDSKSRPSMVKSNSADLPTYKRSSPIYKATDIAGTFLETLRKGCSDRQRHYSGGSISRGKSVDQAVISEALKHSPPNPADYLEWTSEKRLKRESNDSFTTSQSVCASDPGGGFPSPIAMLKNSPIRSRARGSPDMSTKALSANMHAKADSKTVGEKFEINEKLHKPGCSRCESSISFREEDRSECLNCVQIHHQESGGGVKDENTTKESAALPFQIDLQNFDEEFIEHVTEKYDSKNIKLNGQFHPHRGSSSFDFSDFQPKHKITWSQHKEFSTERKLRKSATLPFRAQSLSERQELDKIPNTFEKKDFEMIPGEAITDYSGSETSERKRDGADEESTLYGGSVLNQRASENETGDGFREDYDLLHPDEKSRAMPDFANRCRSDGEAEGDSVSRRDKLTKMRKWNTFDSGNQDFGKGRFVNIFYGRENVKTENYGQQSEEDEILQIVIESKRRNDSIADDAVENDSPCADSLISVQTEDASSKSLEDSYHTSDEASPVIMLMDSNGYAAEGHREELVGVSPFSGLSNKSGNSDWSENDEMTPKRNGKSRDATRRYFLKGDWSPQFVDLYYHADTGSQSSSVKSLNAESPSRQSYKTNSISSASPVAKETPVQRRRSRHDLSNGVLGIVGRNSDAIQGSLHAKTSLCSCDQDAEFSQNKRTPSKTDKKIAEENRVNAYITNYLNSLDDQGSTCPLYLRRRLRPHYDDHADQGSLIFPQLGLLSPAVSDPMDIVDSWSCMGYRCVLVAPGLEKASCLSHCCPHCSGVCEDQSFCGDYFRERTLTPTKYRRESSTRHSGTNSNPVTAEVSRSDHSRMGRDVSQGMESYIFEERTLTPTKYRVKKRRSGLQATQNFLSGRNYLEDITNEPYFDSIRPDSENMSEETFVGYNELLEKAGMPHVMPSYKPCVCRHCVSSHSGHGPEGIPYLKRRRKVIKTGNELRSQYATTVAGNVRTIHTGMLQQEQETQTPDEGSALDMSKMNQVPVENENNHNSAKHYLEEQYVLHTEHQHYNCEAAEECSDNTEWHVHIQTVGGSPLHVASESSQTLPTSVSGHCEHSGGMDRPSSMQTRTTDDARRPHHSPLVTINHNIVDDEDMKDTSLEFIQIQGEHPVSDKDAVSAVEEEDGEPDSALSVQDQACHKNSSAAASQGGNGKDVRAGPGMRRQSTVDTLDSGITEDGSHCHQLYMNDLFESVVSNLEENFNIPLYMPSY